MPLMSAARLALKEVPKLTTSSSFSPMSSALRGHPWRHRRCRGQSSRGRPLRLPPAPSGRRSGRPRRPWRQRTGRPCHRCAPARRWRRSGLRHSVRPIRRPPRSKLRCWQRQSLPCWRQRWNLRPRRSRSEHRRRVPRRSGRPPSCGECVFSCVSFLSCLKHCGAEQKGTGKRTRTTKKGLFACGTAKQKDPLQWFGLFGTTNSS